MKFKKAIGIGCLSLIAALLLFWLSVIGAFQLTPSNPFVQNDICFREEQPGATGRFILYVPVRCSNESQRLDPGFGADYATMNFEDVDGDDRPELIITSSSFRCQFSTGACYDAWRITVKVCPNCNPIFTVVDKRYLEELTPEGQAR